jgi:PTS system nitrogen regulatory IIA component
MHIIDYLQLSAIIPDLAHHSKREVLEELAATLVPGLENLDLQAVVDVLMERERLGSTGIGDNVAFPHGKIDRLSQLRLAFGRSLRGVNFDSTDGKPSHLFFLLLAPTNAAGLHLKALAKISRMMMMQNFRDDLMKASAREEIYALLAAKDAEL